MPAAGRALRVLQKRCAGFWVWGSVLGTVWGITQGFLDPQIPGKALVHQVVTCQDGGDGRADVEAVHREALLGPGAEWGAGQNCT